MQHLLRFGVFVVCWVLCATLYYQFAKPDFTPAKTEFFYVCAHKIGDSADDYPVHALTQIQQNPSIYRLCNTPTQWQSSNINTNHIRMTLEQTSDGNWYLKRWTDSLGDPSEMIYHIDDSTITPLLYRNGTQLTMAMGIFLGLFLGLGLSRIFWWFWHRFYKKDGT